MIKSVILFTLLLVAVACEPRPTYGGTLFVHTHTYHQHQEGQEIEAFTPGLGYETDGGYRFGALRNSFGIPSVYAVKTFPENKRFRFGLGAISGYEWTGRGLRGRERGAVPIVGAEYDILDNVSVVWFGQALNLVLKWELGN